VRTACGQHAAAKCAAARSAPVGSDPNVVRSSIGAPVMRGGGAGQGGKGGVLPKRCGIDEGRGGWTGGGVASSNGALDSRRSTPGSQQHKSNEGAVRGKSIRRRRTRKHGSLRFGDDSSALVKTTEAVVVSTGRAGQRQRGGV
jgi:hypothetical protein